MAWAGVPSGVTVLALTRTLASARSGEVRRGPARLGVGWRRPGTTGRSLGRPKRSRATPRANGGWASPVWTVQWVLQRCEHDRRGVRVADSGRSPPVARVNEGGDRIGGDR